MVISYINCNIPPAIDNIVKGKDKGIEIEMQ